LTYLKGDEKEGLEKVRRSSGKMVGGLVTGKENLEKLEGIPSFGMSPKGNKKPNVTTDWGGAGAKGGQLSTGTGQWPSQKKEIRGKKARDERGCVRHSLPFL